jgi:hypothetical protein
MPKRDRQTIGISPFPLSPLTSTIERRPEYATAIGMISIEIANLEIFLGELLGAILHIDRHYGTVVYLTPQANLARVQILENVMRDTLVEDTQSRKHIEDILEETRRVIGKRHELIHNAWGLAANNLKQVTRRSLPYKDHLPPKPVTVKELTTLLESIRLLSSVVRETTDAAFLSWPPYTWRETPPGQSPEELIPEPPSIRQSPLKDKTDRPDRKR